MKLHEICEHPWFRNNAPIRPVVTLESLQEDAKAAEDGASGSAATSNSATGAGIEITRQSKNITIEGNINNVDYQVISKP